jgi:TonB family protein
LALGILGGLAGCKSTQSDAPASLTSPEAPPEVAAHAPGPIDLARIFSESEVSQSAQIREGEALELLAPLLRELPPSEVSLVIDAEGYVGEMDLRAIESASTRELIWQAFQTCRFEPARMGTQPVAVRLERSFGLAAAAEPEPVRAAPQAPPNRPYLDELRIASTRIDLDQLEAPVPTQVDLPDPVALPLAEHGYTGFAVLTFEVDRYGYVSRARVREASDESVGQAALQAAQRWRFQPAQIAGEPVALPMRARILFPPSDPLGYVTTEDPR